MFISSLKMAIDLSGVDIMKVLLYIIMKTSQDLLDQVIQNMMNDDENSGHTAISTHSPTYARSLRSTKLVNIIIDIF
jgi:hypothetical protein